MKKKMSVLLSVILCLSLFGCSNTSSRSSAEPTSALGSAPPAESSEPSDDKLIIRLASITSANPDAYEYQAGLLFQEKVAEYSNGSMEVQYYPASQLGNSLEMLEGVSMGTIEMGMSVGFDVYANLDPICQVVGMPFLFKDYDHMRAFLEGDSDAIQEIRNSMIENIDTRIMGYCYRPFRSVVSMSNDIYAPSDMAGMTIRSPESKANMQWIEDMGATPVTISWSELYTSLSTGAAQGAENSITEFHSGNFQDILTSASETNHMAVTCLLTCNNSWYESLTDAQREVMDKASADFNQFMWEQFQDASETAWKAFEEAGVTVIRNDQIDTDAFREASASVYKAFVDAGYFTEDLYQSILNLDY